jgi:hypothetical protein
VSTYEWWAKNPHLFAMTVWQLLSREYADHASLKSSRCIAQPKRHVRVGKCPKRTGKCCLLLIFRVYKDLVISRITIQEAIIFVPS